ncbi:MAG: imidazolonepropionase [Phycisphaerae bacterium]|nr:imidazolonepropionase [Phycisphaerae bacterium]
MPPFTIINARVLTMAGRTGSRRGAAAGDLGVIERGYVRVLDGRIEDVGHGEPAGPLGSVVDAQGCVLLPGFVDCHTHACWAGDRYDEADQRLAGVAYLTILERGGGIMSTVRATRAASQSELAALTLGRLREAAGLGTTTIEVKSGYGLTPDDELKMLRAIHEAARSTPQMVRATFLGAHAKDPAHPDFVRETIEVTLPRAVAAFPGIVCDAFCEQGAWSLDECLQLFAHARRLGCPVRVHADQFHALGMTSAAVEMGALSVDHLEASTNVEIARLASSATIGVALPGCGFHLDGRFAPARALLDQNGALAIATNCNPGSSPTLSMAFVIALAVRHLELTPAEAIVAATINAACVLGLDDRVGSIERGKRADLQLLASHDERSLAYQYAGSGPRHVWIAGTPV